MSRLYFLLFEGSLRHRLFSFLLCFGYFGSGKRRIALSRNKRGKSLSLVDKINLRYRILPHPYILLKGAK